nr:hypothetical protein [uncultured Desulfobacter sp.]
MNPGRTPVWIGCSHPPDQITDFTTDLRPSRAFGFEFPEKFETLAMPVDNSIRLYNDERFTPVFVKKVVASSAFFVKFLGINFHCCFYPYPKKFVAPFQDKSRKKSVPPRGSLPFFS